jgi:hypothetical protein
MTPMEISDVLIGIGIGVGAATAVGVGIFWWFAWSFWRNS